MHSRGYRERNSFYRLTRVNSKSFGWTLDHCGPAVRRRRNLAFNMQLKIERSSAINQMSPGALFFSSRKTYSYERVVWSIYLSISRRHGRNTHRTFPALLSFCPVLRGDREITSGKSVKPARYERNGKGEKESRSRQSDRFSPRTDSPRGKKRAPAHILGARVVHATAATRIYFYLNLLSFLLFRARRAGRSAALILLLCRPPLSVPPASELIAALVFFAVCRPRCVCAVCACTCTRVCKGAYLRDTR